MAKTTRLEPGQPPQLPEEAIEKIVERILELRRNRDEAVRQNLPKPSPQSAPEPLEITLKFNTIQPVEF